MTGGSAAGAALVRLASWPRAAASSSAVYGLGLRHVDPEHLRVPGLVELAVAVAASEALHQRCVGCQFGEQHPRRQIDTGLDGLGGDDDAARAGRVRRRRKLRALFGAFLRAKAGVDKKNFRLRGAGTSARSRFGFPFRLARSCEVPFEPRPQFLRAFDGVQNRQRGGAGLVLAGYLIS